MTVALSERLQRAQNYCLRFIFNLDRGEHITPFFNQLGVLTLKRFRSYHILMLLFKIISFKSPEYLSIKFRFLGEVGRGVPEIA
ncbi:hypothetical protein LSTR_LSTR000057 [Laodelphax striatellus]|uniref:Uncharacterized protein n=1 Tax=Laodelphax striatellus TaxID=195883 RepID=A0A482X6K4_LAOST|nr:hypothetical protein LSTR_LSTR000057 [Laodelphax striatellus]